jgi:hypothetical protein
VSLPRRRAEDGVTFTRRLEAAGARRCLGGSKFTRSPQKLRAAAMRRSYSVRMPDLAMTPQPIELRLTGSFDMPAARKLCDDLIGAARTPFLVDVSQVRELHPDALAHLCRAVSLLRGRVAMRGLSRHHFRLLAYLGAPLPRRGMARRRRADP